MRDQLPWLQTNGYVNDEAEDMVILHRDMPNEARVTVRLDGPQWSVVSFAHRADKTCISFVITGIENDQLHDKLNQCETELAWLFDQFNDK